MAWSTLARLRSTPVKCYLVIYRDRTEMIVVNCLSDWRLTMVRVSAMRCPDIREVSLWEARPAGSPLRLPIAWFEERKQSYVPNYVWTEYRQLLTADWCLHGNADWSLTCFELFRSKRFSASGVDGENTVVAAILSVDNRPSKHSSEQQEHTVHWSLSSTCIWQYILLLF